MTGDLARTLAVVFRRKGGLEISATDFKHALSLDLRWFAPADARKLLAHAVNTGLVEEQGERLRATFDIARVEVPVTFRPSLDVLEESPAPLPPAPRAPPAPAPAPAAGAPPAPPAPAPAAEKGTVAEEAVLAAARAADLAPEDVQREVAAERARRANLFTEEVSALVVARRHGVDVRAMAARLRAEKR